MKLLLDATFKFYVKQFLRLENLINLHILLKWNYAVSEFPEGMKNPTSLLLRP